MFWLRVPDRIQTTPSIPKAPINGHQVSPMNNMKKGHPHFFRVWVHYDGVLARRLIVSTCAQQARELENNSCQAEFFFALRKEKIPIYPIFYLLKGDYNPNIYPIVIWQFPFSFPLSLYNPTNEFVGEARMMSSSLHTPSFNHGDGSYNGMQHVVDGSRLTTRVRLYTRIPHPHRKRRH